MMRAGWTTGAEATTDEVVDAVCDGTPAGAEEVHTEGGDESTVASATSAPHEPALEVYGDSAYDAGDVLAHLDEHNITAYVKVQPPSAPEGQFSKDSFRIDLDNATVTCPSSIPSRFVLEAMGLVTLTLASCARSALCALSARRVPEDARSTSILMNRSSRGLASNNVPVPRGGNGIAPRAQRSNARLLT